MKNDKTRARQMEKDKETTKNKKLQIDKKYQKLLKNMEVKEIKLVQRKFRKNHKMNVKRTVEAGAYTKQIRRTTSEA